MASQEGKLNELDRDDNSSSDDVSFSGGSKSTDTDDQKKDAENAKDQFAERETRNVFFLRLLVFVVLLLASLGVSIVVYFIAENSQNNAFLTQYEGAAKQVTESFKAIVAEKLGAISAIGVALTAHSVDHDKVWPFVTLSSFQERASTAQSLSEALFIGVGPYVTDENRVAWEEYVVSNASYWVAEAFEYQEKLGIDKFLRPAQPGDNRRFLNITEKSDPIYYYPQRNDDTKKPDEGPGPYLPAWQTSPILSRSLINQNILRSEGFSWGSKIAKNTSSIVVGRMAIVQPGNWDDTNTGTSFYATVISISRRQFLPYKGDPMSLVYLPVFNSFHEDRYPVAMLYALFNWGSYFENVLPSNVKGISLVIENSCDGAFTYEIEGQIVAVVGKGDHHETKFNNLQRVADWHDTTSISDGTEAGLPFNQDNCPYRISVYPTSEFYRGYHTKTPIFITFAIAFIFVITACLFLVYDRLVERRQQLVMRKAVQSTAIVSSLFPENVRERLLQDNAGVNAGNFVAPNHRLKNYLKGDGNDADMGLSPIADLFPHATVFFGDIAGFTAWSSTRDPAQVFILLQTVYQAFDVLAKKRRVFKVETIGDSYVAVTGLPEPQEHHAVIMARFASECMVKMEEVTKDLEVTLGPDTGELSMRMGIHSGPVTAGVLRGERSRFQLFGDTVNTAARMESTGQAGKIQVSHTTAELLKQAGKEHWMRPRKDVVEAKGKGVLHTYWLSPTARKSLTNTTIGEDDTDQKSVNPFPPDGMDNAATVKQERLVNWIVDLLADHVKAIVAKRRVLGMKDSSSADLVYMPPAGHTTLGEFAEVITLPRFDARTAAQTRDFSQITLDPVVLSELKDYVSTISFAYRSNPFHNFEHACHVTMAVNKFLKRIVAPDIDIKQMDKDMSGVASQIHDYTHGINSDPLALFAIVFSALIHDADHRGVSNAQLIKEDEKLAAMYEGKSVAEQNSLDLSWGLLMSDQFAQLRRCIFATQSELRRFRQVIVNMVLATDIFDQELNELRKDRWNKAFSGNNSSHNDKFAKDNDLRATIVIEHIIQASDVSHTMQHWHIYRKWNQRLFQELYKAYVDGRMALNPATFWYKGELGFFDNYVIPLAKKLKDCNVFGVSSDECLNYALKNRAEWEQRGQEVVEEMIKELASE